MVETVPTNIVIAKDSICAGQLQFVQSPVKGAFRPVLNNSKITE